MNDDLSTVTVCVRVHLHVSGGAHLHDSDGVHLHDSGGVRY